MTLPYYIAVTSANPGGNSTKQVKEIYDYSIDTKSYIELQKHIFDICEHKKIITISQDPNLPNKTTAVYSKLLDVLSVVISNNPVICEHPDVLYIGIDKTLISDEAISQLDNNLITYYTFEKIKQIRWALA